MNLLQFLFMQIGDKKLKRHSRHIKRIATGEN